MVIDEREFPDYTMSLTDTLNYETLILQSFNGISSNYIGLSSEFFKNIKVPVYNRASLPPFVNMNVVHSNVWAVDNSGFRMFVDFFLGGMNGYALYKKLPLLVKFYCGLHDVLDGKITEAEANDFTVIQAISKYDTALRVAPMWQAFKELWAEAIDVMKVPGLPRIDDYARALDALGTPANPGGPIFTLITKGFGQTQNRVLAMRDATKNDPNWNPNGIVFESNGPVTFLDELLYENVSSENGNSHLPQIYYIYHSSHFSLCFCLFVCLFVCVCVCVCVCLMIVIVENMFSLIHLISSDRAKNLELEGFANMCISYPPGGMPQFNFINLTKQAVQKFTQNKFRVDYKRVFCRVCRFNYSVGSFLEAFDPMNSVKSLDVYTKTLTGTAVGTQRMNEAQEKAVIKELSPCSEEVLVSLSEVLSSTLCYVLKNKHDEALISSLVPKSVSDVYKNHVSSAGIPADVGALTLTLGSPMCHSVHVAEVLLSIINGNKTMFKDFDQSYRLLMPRDMKKALDDEEKKVRSPLHSSPDIVYFLNSCFIFCF